MQQQEVSGVQHDLLVNIELQMPRLLVIVLFFGKLRLCNLFLCFMYKIFNFVAKSSDYGCVVSVTIARSIEETILFPYNSANAGF